MKVSIITSCFNRAATIRGAIESVLAQDYNNIEFIVVDGASTDGSLEIIREYEGRISTIISEPDHGTVSYTHLLSGGWSAQFPIMEVVIVMLVLYFPIVWIQNKVPCLIGKFKSK